MQRVIKVGGEVDVLVVVNLGIHRAMDFLKDSLVLGVSVVSQSWMDRWMIFTAFKQTRV